MAFYSLYFTGHLWFAGTAVYVKDGTVAGARSASFFLAVSGQGTPEAGQGEDSAFMLLHRLPVRILTAVWTPLSGNETIARKHALATMTAGAGALVVVLLYEALLWCGVVRWRAMLFAGVLGASSAMTFLAALPQPQIFSALGLMAALAAMVRGRSARWWEFSAAALYACLCSCWNIAPVLLMMLVRVGRIFRAGGGWRSLFAMVLSVILLAAAVWGAIKIQSRVYSVPDDGTALQLVTKKWEKACRRTWETTWTDRMHEALFESMLISPDTLSNPKAPMAGHQERRSYTVPGTPWFEMNRGHSGWVLWSLMMGLAVIGWFLPQCSRSAIAAALLVVGWSLWFYGATESPGERMLWPVLWTPLLMFLVAAGVEACLQRWSFLKAPVTLLSVLLIVVQVWSHQQWLVNIARQVAL